MEISPVHAVVLLLGGIFGGLIFMVALAFILYFFLQRHHITTTTSFSSTGEISKTGSPSPAPSRRRRLCSDGVSRGSTASMSSSHSTRPKSLGVSCTSFTYEELAKATDDFSESNLLGQGGFGPVHKGVLPGGKLVAVKQLDCQSSQGEREFQSEIDIISRIHHKHLVSLVGFCIDGDKKLLVYEYMENNSLASHLHGSEVPTVDWATRMQITKGAAYGLAYLHEDCEPRIIHRDIKSANILLDSNFRAKVSDFGIAKRIPDADTHMTTPVVGTLGWKLHKFLSGRYLAPEYGSNGRLTEKSDVYSFGVVLLELISGQKPHNFVHLAKPLLFQALRDDIYDEIVDPKLANAYNRDEMLRMVVCVLACIDDAPEDRPKMLEVVRVLDRTMSVEELKARVMSRGASNVRSHAQDQGFGNKHLRISNCTSFTYEELAKATDKFSESNFLGRGGFGPVHKGVLHGKVVAVKQLNCQSTQGVEEFQSEIEIISRIHHRHLVRLFGFCIDGDKRLLVYELMENNSLAFHLHRSEAPTMDWATRMQIALGAANGLAYLHEDCEPRIIHRDIKSANILLDSNFRAKVSDFGVAKWFPDVDTHVSTRRIIGTPGYVAPEYVMYGRLTEKLDIYSFGVVLLELVSGKKPGNIVHPAKPLLFHALRDDNYDEVVDPKLANAYDRDEMLRMVVCAAACVDHVPECRPKMLEVVRVLGGTVSAEELKTRVMSRGTSTVSQIMETSREPVAVETQVQDQGYSSTANTLQCPSVPVNNMRKRFRKFLELAAGAFYARDQGYGYNHLAISNCTPFKYEELAKATDDFSESNFLGRGGFGGVYKGVLLDGKLVAVKQFKYQRSQGIPEFHSEVEIISGIRHRHLVSLLGFCIKGHKRLLVYEYMGNGALDFHLHDPERRAELNWPKRYNIIKGIARGMLYLHEDSRLRIIHRDLKAANILLDAEMNPKISDFGMARIFDIEQTQYNTSRIVGTYGYMAPEYVVHGRYSVKSDVYSFGVLMLEIVSGKRISYFFQSGMGETLLSYAWNCWKDGRPLEIMDPTLRESYATDEFIRCIHVGLLCVQEDTSKRPTMAIILRIFESDSAPSTLSVPERPAWSSVESDDHSSAELTS